jgi:NAD(P)H-flavin reductase
MISPLAPTAGHGVWQARRARIENIAHEATGVATYELRLIDEASQPWFSFEPGQFNMLYLPGFGEAAISISTSADRHDTLGHTVRVAGNVTRALSRRRAGEEIGLRGPFGSAWPVDACRGGDVVIACGGIGLAPLRPAIYHIMNRRDDYGRVVLLYGARTPSDLLFTREYRAWQEAGIEVELTVDIGDGDWNGHIGVVPLLFYRRRLQPEITRVFTCGPEIMMRFVIFEALARKIRPRHIHLSMERHMSCGAGLCGHCQVGPYFVCRDGPIFTYDQMQRYLTPEDL